MTKSSPIVSATRHKYLYMLALNLMGLSRLSPQHQLRFLHQVIPAGLLGTGGSIYELRSHGGMALLVTTAFLSTPIAKRVHEGFRLPAFSNFAVLSMRVSPIPQLLFNGFLMLAVASTKTLECGLSSQIDKQTGLLLLALSMLDASIVHAT